MCSGLTQGGIHDFVGTKSSTKLTSKRIDLSPISASAKRNKTLIQSKICYDFGRFSRIYYVFGTVLFKFATSADP